jgi:hypothetical protein
VSEFDSNISLSDVGGYDGALAGASPAGASMRGLILDR